jgi:hypothetical protein
LFHHFSLSKGKLSRKIFGNAGTTFIREENLFILLDEGEFPDVTHVVEPIGLIFRLVKIRELDATYLFRRGQPLKGSGRTSGSINEHLPRL